MKSAARKILRRIGYDLVRRDTNCSDEFDGLTDLSEKERAILATSRPFTMTSRDRMASLVESVKFIVQNKIEGDIAECGVWRGGSMMVIASMLSDAKRKPVYASTFVDSSQTHF